MYSNPYEYLEGKINDQKIVKAGYHEKKFRCDGLSLNYVVGPDNGPALLLIPAQMGTWESYAPVLLSLGNKFQVYAIDLRGHGKSTWTPGSYSWKIIGEDLEKFIEKVIGRKTIIAGNSSGGIIALWCAANIPEMVDSIILEDAPVFSVEMPRFKERDKFVYRGLEHLVNTIGDVENRNIANYFRGLKLPLPNGKSRQLPNWIITLLAWRVKRFQARHPERPIEVGILRRLKMMMKSLSMFDPDFARAFVDGRFYQGINHEQALKKVECPMLVIHASWQRYPSYGLVGAMDDDDAKRIMELVPHTKYVKVDVNHVVHSFKPKLYVALLSDFTSENENLSK